MAKRKVAKRVQKRARGGDAPFMTPPRLQRPQTLMPGIVVHLPDGTVMHIEPRML